jgi:predicted SAM-dependent methyltransferase
MMDATKPWKCPDETWDGIFCEHVLEHMTYTNAVKLLAEARRTLKPGAWIRLVIPDLSIYVRNYMCNGAVLPYLGHPAIAMSSLTQSWGHASVWDGGLACEVLGMTGFREVTQASFGIGRDHRLIKDQRDRSIDSLYVEARK